MRARLGPGLASRLAAPFAGVLLLAGCDAAAMQGQINQRAAQSVIVNALGSQYARPAAELATGCVIANATPGELASLARDVGTRAGTSTMATILAVGQRPATISCLTGQGLQLFAVPL